MSAISTSASVPTPTLSPGPRSPANNPPTSAKDMSFHKPRRLSPIPQSDLESDFHDGTGGDSVDDAPVPISAKAIVRDVPVYRPSIATPGSDSFDPARASTTHDTQDLLAKPEPLHLSQRPQSRGHPDRDFGTRGFAAKSETPEHYRKAHFEFVDLQNNTRKAPSSPQTTSTTMSSPTNHSNGGTSSPDTSDSETIYDPTPASLPPLQHKSGDDVHLEPVEEEGEGGSYDLVTPQEDGKQPVYSLETRSEQLFSREHLEVIFSDPVLLLRFTSYLSAHRVSSIPILVYYLDSFKALKAISYSNAIAEALDPIPGVDFTKNTSARTTNSDLEAKSKFAFDILVREDLPAYITHSYIQTVSQSIQSRITGTLPPHLREASEGLAEVFCLTDPSRPDNPIIFASEEFHRTTQYGMSHVIGRNCRFLQGPKTNRNSVRRIRETVKAGVEHCEVFLNYRRDGSPFMNLQMTAPLCDSRGNVKYFIGAQVDVSGLVKDCAELESFQRLVEKIQMEESRNPNAKTGGEENPKDEFQELSEMFNLQELETVRRCGGRMHKESTDENVDNSNVPGSRSRPRLVINPNSPDGTKYLSQYERAGGKLAGIYEHYLLVRPYPSLRILFASPAQRTPGILQSPFMSKIGGSNRVREELTQALAEGNGVTAKVKWISRADSEGRNRWIHCTPLIGANGAIGVWMVVIVDDEAMATKRFKVAPPIDPKFGRSQPIAHKHDARDFGLVNGGRNLSSALSYRDGSMRSYHDGSHVGSDRSGSAFSLRLE